MNWLTKHVFGAGWVTAFVGIDANSNIDDDGSLEESFVRDTCAVRSPRTYSNRMDTTEGGANRMSGPRAQWPTCV